jgi:hypothetical protein
MTPEPGEKYCMVCKLKTFDKHQPTKLILFGDDKESNDNKKRSKIWNRYFAIIAGAGMCAVPMSIAFRLIVSGDVAGPLVVMLGIVFSIKGFLSFQRVYLKITTEDDDNDNRSEQHPMQITGNPF